MGYLGFVRAGTLLCSFFSTGRDPNSLLFMWSDEVVPSAWELWAYRLETSSTPRPLSLEGWVSISMGATASSSDRGWAFDNIRDEISAMLIKILIVYGTS